MGLIDTPGFLLRDYNGDLVLLPCCFDEPSSSSSSSSSTPASSSSASPYHDCPDGCTNLIGSFSETGTDCDHCGDVYGTPLTTIYCDTVICPTYGYDHGCADFWCQFNGIEGVDCSCCCYDDP